MARPTRTPVGVHLATVARRTERAFNEALAAAGGSLPVWLVLLHLKTGRSGNQRELADAVGVRQATLTHHLNALEADGRLTRRRDPGSRRSHVVEMTESGEELFIRLRTAAGAFDARLREGIAKADLDAFEAMLDRLATNVDPGPSGDS